MSSKKCFALILSALACVSTVPLAQAMAASSGEAPLDLYSPRQLLDRSQALKQKAKASGSASEILQKYAGHYTMLGYRDRSGAAELHRDFADTDVILEGTATLISGGTMVDAKTTAEGESRGSSIQGGQSTRLHKGDILHIPANVPHQMLIPAGGSLTYFVIKSLESTKP